MRIILSCLVALLLVTTVDAGGRRSRQRAAAQSNVVWDSQPVVSSAPVSAEATSQLKGSADAMAEVNAKRASKGLPPLRKDSLLCQAALLVSKQRAARGIHGHLPESDFTYVHQVNGSASVGGCGALEDSWGWETCAYDSPQYSVGGAAWVRGSDGLRYMTFFGRP